MTEIGGQLLPKRIVDIATSSSVVVCASGMLVMGVLRAMVHFKFIESLGMHQIFINTFASL